MIINGRRPTMRHVTRTHGVALDRLFDRMNSDRKIQIKYVDTKNQFAEILTKGSFTRDEGNHDLCQFNIMSNSMFSCSHLRNQIKDPHTMSKRQMQQRKQGGEDERVVAKSKPARNLVSKTLNRSPTALSSSLSQSPERVQFWIQSVRGSPQRWIRLRTTHRALKCSMHVQTRTPAQEYLLRGDKEPSWYKIVPSQFWTCHQATSSTLRKLTRTYDVNLVARRTTKWSGSTPTQWSADHLWMRRWRRRYMSA